MNALNIAQKWLLLFPLIWVMGLTPVYSIALIPLIIILIQRLPNNMVVLGLLFFGLIQILSSTIALLGPFQDPYRFAAIFHNIYLYFILVFGTVLVYRYGLQSIFNEKILCYLIIAFAITGGLVFYYSLVIAGTEISIPGILERSRLTRNDFLFESKIPRLSLFGDYVNTTAMLSLFMFTIAILIKKKSGFILSLIVFISSISIAIMAGSRVTVVAIALLLPLALTQKPKNLAFIMAIVAVGGVLIIQATPLMELIEGVQSSRENSSNTRFMIYQHSLQMTLEVNPFTGLGIKPVLPYIIDFPLGSHSTFFGYVIKCGALGLAFVIMYFTWLLIKTLLYTYSTLSGKSTLKILLGFYILLIITMVLCFEDIDAYALNAFLCGMILGEILRNERIKQINPA